MLRDSTTNTSVPASRPQLPVLNGLRVLSILWVIIFHLGWVPGLMGLTESEFIAFFHSNFHALSGLVRTGYNGVEVLFLITGFLLALPYFHKYFSEQKDNYCNKPQNTEKAAVSNQEEFKIPSFFQYITSRLARLYPLLILLIAFSFITKKPPKTRDPPTTLAWLSTLVIMNNFADLAGPLTHTWSLSLQWQFTLLFFILLVICKNPHTMAKYCTIWVIFSTTVLRAINFAVFFAGIDKFPYYMYDPVSKKVMSDAFSFFYSSFIIRGSCLFAGVVMCYLHLNPAPLKRIVDKYIPQILLRNAIFLSITQHLIVFVSLYLFFFTGHSYTYGIVPDATVTIFTTTSSLYQTSLLCIAFLGIVNNFVPIFTKFLSLDIFSKLAYPTYAVFLYHPLIIAITIMAKFSPIMEKLIYQTSFYYYSTIVLAVSFGLAWVLTRFIEEPVQRMVVYHMNGVEGKDNDYKPNAILTPIFKVSRLVLNFFGDNFTALFKTHQFKAD